MSSFYSVNRVTLVGRLGQDPDVRTTTTGMVVANLSIATDRARKVDDEWQSETDWHRVVCFGKLAEFMARSAAKGQVAYVEGGLRTEKWTDRDGNDRWTTKVYAEKIIIVSPKGERSSSSTAEYEQYARDHGLNDDIPF
jgi:single-strand DNA-binding protein